MRILFNCMNLGKGGAERVISILANYWCENNEVKIITHLNMPIKYKFNEKIKINSISKEKNNRNKIKKFLSRISIKNILKLKKEVLLFNPDIIISFLPEPSFKILLLKKFCKSINKIPVVVSVRNDPKTEYSNPVYRWIMKKLYPLADELILQTEESKKYFNEMIKKNGTVIFNPVENEFLCNPYKGKRKKNIVAVGRLNKQKNYKNMIDAFEKVLKKHSEYTLNIYGEGELRKELQNYIEEKFLQERIFLMGQVDDIKTHIYTATAFVMASDYEGMPNALLEAACLGIPCISTDCPCGGPKQILGENNNGILVKIKDSEDLAKAICTIIENPEVATKYSNNCMKLHSIYSVNNIIEQWNKVIDKYRRKNQ